MRASLSAACSHGYPEDKCPACSACAACDGSCGTCPYVVRPSELAWCHSGRTTYWCTCTPPKPDSLPPGLSASIQE